MFGYSDWYFNASSGICIAIGLKRRGNLYEFNFNKFGWKYK